MRDTYMLAETLVYSQIVSRDLMAGLRDAHSSRKCIPCRLFYMLSRWRQIWGPSIARSVQRDRCNERRSDELAIAGRGGGRLAVREGE